MKMDKQTLAKHHFWILLGVFGLFSLILIILVPVLIGAEIEDKETQIKKVNKDLEQSSQGPTTKGFLDAQQVQIDTLGVRRDTIWRDMYRRQGGILTFPSDLANRLDEINFGGEIDDRSRDKYRSEEVYRATYERMSAMIAPTEYEDGSWTKVLQPATWKVLPSSEEVWLSLEDLCVRREVLNILAEANMTGAHFKLVKDAKGLPPSKLGPNFSKRWVSRDFQLDLLIEKRGVGRYAFGGKLKNLSNRRLSTGEFQIDVRLTPDLSETEPAKPIRIDFPIDPVAAGQETDLKVIELQPNLTPVDIFSVELHHTLQTVPIKRLIQLVLGRNAGHRMADRKLEMAKFSAPPPDASGAGGAPPPGTGTPQLAPGMGGGGGTGGGGASSSGGSEKTSTLNGINKLRYIEITDQVRRMPIAVVMVIDQTCLQDVLAAFSNSPQLRFQITQYHWQRFYGTIGASTNDRSNPGGPTNPGAPSNPGRPSMPSGSGSGGPAMGIGGGGNAGTVGGAGGSGLGGPAGSSAKKSSDQASVSLIELTVYGVANLYERPKNLSVSADLEPKAPATAPEMPATKPADTSKPAPEPTKSPEPSKQTNDKPTPAPSDKPAGANPAKPMDPKSPDKPNNSGSPEPAKPKDGGADKTKN